MRQLVSCRLSGRSPSLSAPWPGPSVHSSSCCSSLRMLSMALGVRPAARLYAAARRDDLRVDYGLLTKISGTIPLQRIQTLTISESPLHRLFGRVSVHVDTAGGHGGEVQQTRREPIAPLVTRRNLAALIDSLMPAVTLERHRLAARAPTRIPPSARSHRCSWLSSGAILIDLDVALVGAEAAVGLLFGLGGGLRPQVRRASRLGIRR